MGWLQALAAEFAITVVDDSVWLTIGQGLVFGAVCLLFGVWVARFVGLLDRNAPAGETLGVGLASGLLVVAAWWAAIASGGRSSFTPVAVGFAIAIALAMARRRRFNVNVEVHLEEAGHELGSSTPANSVATDADAERPPRYKSLMVAVLGGAAFIAVVALLYGSTMVLSPRDGIQPLEFNDEAYYSVLGADLAKTGTETNYSPSGFAVVAGLPSQSWYHWGELWLASLLITVIGMGPLDARHFVVLPIVLLAAAALTGTIVRRLTGATSRGAFLFGFLACLFLAPVPLIQGPLLGALTVGLIFGITAYGLAAVALLLALYGLTVLGRRPSTWALATFAGSAAALIVPAHVVIAFLAVVGVGSAWAARIGQSLLATRRMPVVSALWRRTFIVTVFAVIITVVWGLLTGHVAFDVGASPDVSPFNAFWRGAVVLTLLGAGAVLSIPVAWFMARKGPSSIEADLYRGTAVLIVTGAIGWGALLGSFITTHLFVAAIGVFATPAAAVGAWSIWRRLRFTGHLRVATAVLVLCVAQMEFGIAMGVVRLQSFGPNAYEPVPEEVLAEIRSLPPDAKLAYACLPTEEVEFWEARLLGLDAHTGRRIVPMCFQAEVNASLTGTATSAEIPNPLFRLAPQHALYPDSDAHPSAARIATFLKTNGIDYIYADTMHPNSLVPDALTLAKSGQVEILQVP